MTFFFTHLPKSNFDLIFSSTRYQRKATVVISLLKRESRINRPNPTVSTFRTLNCWNVLTGGTSWQRDGIVQYSKSYSTVYIVQYSLQYGVHCTVYPPVRCTLYNIAYSTVYILHCTAYPPVRCTLYFILYNSV